MDPISALAVASAVVQFVKLGVEVAKRLAEYDAALHDAPKPLRSINTRLPLLINALSRIQSESEVSNYDEEIRSILQGVVLGCLKLVRELDDITHKIRPKHGESIGTKLKKVFSTLRLEDRIIDIDLGLQGYISVLILHRVVDRSTAKALPVEETRYFGVKEKRIAEPLARDALISQLDKSFFEAARGQKEIPEYVILLGDAGTGKSQLALTYCHQAYEVGQFETVFWLDASSPVSLKLGLESIASTIRRTKEGTSEEKLKFIDGFLTERWHPWLLILDNYQHKEYHSESITQYLPQKGNGAFLLTTRDYDMPPLGTVIKVHKVLTTQEEKDLRYTVTKAIYSKDLDTIKDTFEQGLNVDSYSHTVWGRDGEPLVNIAAEAAFDEALQYLLGLGANPHLDQSMHAVLASAVRSGSLSTITLYLDHEDEEGQTLDEENYDWAFRVAIEKGDTPALKELLKRREHHFKPYARRVGEGVVSASENGHLDVLRHLVSVNKFSTDTRQQATALCKAVEKKELQTIKFLLSEAHVNPSIPDEYGESALHYAASIGHRDPQARQIRDEIVSLLLAAGASPNVPTRSNKRTPLHRAAAYGLDSTVGLLLKYGADVTCEDENNLTPLMLAIDWKSPAVYPLLTNVEIEATGREKYFAAPMFGAARTGDRELALLILKKGILDTVEESTGETALLAAIKNSQVPMARILIRNAANQNIADKNGNIPLLAAAEKGLELVIRDLAKAANSPGLETSDKKGFTPLILAAQTNHEKAVKVLLDLGADKDAVNQYGESALDVVEEKGFEDIIKMLQGI